MGYIRDSIGSIVGTTGGSSYGDPYGSDLGKVYEDGTLVDRYGNDTGYSVDW